MLHRFVNATEIVKSRIDGLHAFENSLSVFVRIYFISQGCGYSIVFCFLALQVAECLMEVTALEQLPI